MPRVARLVIPGYPYHITHRGNNKQTIFITEEDKRKYLYLFEEARKKFNMKVIAYCIMNNHVHYIAIAQDALSFARTINTAHMGYARYFNHKYSCVGHLWQGRYYSCILDDAHLIAAVRYVERNPVRAGIVSKPWDWVWSSAREHLELEYKGIILLENVNVYIPLSSWREYIDMPDLDTDIREIRKQTFAQRAWAEDSFKDLIETKYGVQLKSKKRGRPKKLGTSPI